MRRLLGVALAVMFLVVPVSSVYALETTPPEIILPGDFIGYRNVIESGDFLVFGRFNLPADLTQRLLILGGLPGGHRVSCLGCFRMVRQHCRSGSRCDCSTA